MNVPEYAGGLVANAKMRLPCAATSVPRVAPSGMKVCVVHESVRVSYTSFTPQPHVAQVIPWYGMYEDGDDVAPLLIA